MSNQKNMNSKIGRESIRYEDEAGLLGYILTSKKAVAAYSSAAAHIKPEMFSQVLFEGIFYEIGEAIEDGLTTSWDIMRRLKHLFAENVNMKALQPSCVDFFTSICSSAVIELQYAATIQAIRMEWLIDQGSAAHDEKDFGALAKLSTEVQSIKSMAFLNLQNFDSIGDSSYRVLNDLNEILQTGVIEGYASTGSNALDDAIGGWKPGRFYVVGARPSMGKTTTALSLLRRTAKAGHGVAIFSLEMTTQELSYIALCDTSLEHGYRMEYRDLYSDRFVRNNPTDNDTKVEKIYQAQRELKSIPLRITDKSGMGISDIHSSATKIAVEMEKVGKRLEVIMIDHLNLIKPEDRYRGAKTVETEQISNSLKALSKDLNVAVVCLVQLNRGVEGRDDKMPGLADLRWSGAIEQDADVVMFLYRKAYYLERKREEDDSDEIDRIDALEKCKNEIEILIAKNRGGPICIKKMWCDMGAGAVRDMT
jgi:replicative DNA helicase